MQVREAPLDDPALATQPRAVRGATSGHDWFDASGPEQPAVFVVVIAGVGEHGLGFLARSVGLALDRPGMEVVEQRQQLGNVVSVAARQRDGEWDARRIDEQVVL